MHMLTGVALFCSVLWAQLDTIVIHSSNIVCQTCRRTIIRGLSTRKGIRFVEVDIPNKNIFVVFRSDKTDPSQIRRSVARLGYNADEVPYDKEAYERLPACCKSDRLH
ncbi:MAG: heavy-metal-associated domain-containing protein [Bacteroidia bacterium]|nr:heavy-metal-associated domain-containing protein [Bacteroidia bacterium]